jgi:ubiquinone/menaquinone biosynthesis C-methylase UbiE
MTMQIDALELSSGNRVLDLGCGTGEFEVHLARREDCPDDLFVVAADLVPDALVRMMLRMNGREGVSVHPCNADFETKLPFASESFDRLISSLVISYVNEPLKLLEEMHRVLRPDGMVVLSCPKRDADLSSLYRQAMADLDPDKVTSLEGANRLATFDEIQRGYLNEAARLVDLEESGMFRFWDAAELSRLVRQAGFRILEEQMSLGDPPQTVMIRAMRTGLN